MSSDKDLPNSIRIPCGPDNRHRYWAIKEAQDMYDSSRTDAAVLACDNITSLVDAIEDILQRDDLTLKQKREIAEMCSGRGLDFSVDTEVSTETG